MMKRILLFLLLILGTAFGAVPASAGPFDNWAALVVAGDSRAHSGAPSEVFDNARRDLITALKKMGFAEDHIQQFSARPELDPTTKPLQSDAEQIYVNFKKLAQRTTGGCFIYFTSHGAPLGIVVGDSLVPIRTVADIVDDTCASRPTVIIISACFSGMFIPVMHATNRMIFTAARPDRTSFGCGEANQYTFFDQCVLESLPMSADFHALAGTTKDCVELREKAEGATPPSEPQLYIGSAIAPLLETYKISP
ncbi:MAG TPA: C13 family peptidase [Micropepsaceae bacterium]|nr:C13 family peptidase [Micropepsaceae bacterium]